MGWKPSTFLFISVAVAWAQARPDAIKTSIDQVLKSLQEAPADEPAGLVSPDKRLRSQLITKYDFQRRDKKSAYETPKPFVVTAGLSVGENTAKQATEFNTGQTRSGRQLRLTGSRAAKMLPAGSLAQVVAKAPLVTGVRMPDDESDRVIHRNGRFINNIFVPDGTEVDLPEYTVQSHITQENSPSSPQMRRNGRSGFSAGNEDNRDRNGRRLPFDFSFDSFYSGRKQDLQDAVALESGTNEVFTLPDNLGPQYFLQEDPDSLHADRSPYTFEPADTANRFSQPKPAIIPATNSDFEIREQTYQMCPGCPTFSIPIPVPKSALQPENIIYPYNQDPAYEYQTPKKDDIFTNLVDTITNKLVTTFKPVIETARSWISPVPALSNDISEAHQFSDRLSQVATERQDAVSSPLMFAGMAALGLGIATLVSSGLQLLSFGGIGAREFGVTQPIETDLDNDISLGYNPSELSCIPRNYCEKVKRSKHIIDGFPNTKQVAMWVLERIYDVDKVYQRGETPPFYDQCNLRECLFSLVA